VTRQSFHSSHEDAPLFDRHAMQTKIPCELRPLREIHEPVSETATSTTYQVGRALIEYAKETPTTFRDRVAALFLARPNQWIGGMELAKIGGRYAWRTRVSNCRTELGMTIENRVRTLESGVRVSEYRAVI